MSKITIDRAVVEQALEALRAMNPYPASKEDQRASALAALRTALAQQDEPVAADALTEPKSGDKWRVEWWNESCRMMLPAHAKLDSFVAYKNGTIQFTIKRTAA